MNVTIIGTGNMAKGIGTRLISGGHSINLHAQDIKNGKQLAEELKVVAQRGATVAVAEVGSQADDIVILAIPYSAVAAAGQSYKGFGGKIVVDITNPVDFKTMELLTQPGKAGAQEVAALLPNAKVVKAFNTTFAGTLVAGKIDGKQLDVFIASDDESAKKTITTLVETSDLRPIDAGHLADARHLEGFMLIHMRAQEKLETNWMSAIKIIS